jgi:hypothetical protein
MACGLISACAPGRGVEISILSDRSVEAIQGTWTHCSTNATEGKDVSISYTIEGPATGELIVLHSSTNGTCLGTALMTILRALTLTEGNDSEPLAGSEALDFYYLDGQVAANQASQQAMVAQLTGVASPILGTYYSIQNYDAWTAVTLPSELQILYSRQQVVASANPNELRFGSPISGADDGSSEGKRFQDLSDDVFLKID